MATSLNAHVTGEPADVYGPNVGLADRSDGRIVLMKGATQ
jgi:hypothetical protein